jgi:hypothetical protein
MRRFYLSKSISNVFFSDTVLGSDNEFYRMVFYEFIDGKPMDRIVTNADEDKLKILKISLRNCAESLLDAGGNVFIKDLGDFIFNEETKITKVCDLNAIWDVSNSSLNSRKKLFFLLDKVIEMTVNKEYVAYTDVRPSF